MENNLLYYLHITHTEIKKYRYTLIVNIHIYIYMYIYILLHISLQFIYSCAPFPMQQLPELREKYTYNIRPFSSAGGSKKANVVGGMVLPSDDDDLDEDDLEAITCFTGILPGQLGPNKLKGK